MIISTATTELRRQSGKIEFREQGVMGIRMRYCFSSGLGLGLDCMPLNAPYLPISSLGGVSPRSIHVYSEISVMNSACNTHVK